MMMVVVTFAVQIVMLSKMRGQRNLFFSVLAEISLAITVSTASPERGFSLLKLIVTRLRNRLSQPMVDALMRIKLLKASNLIDDDVDQISKKWTMSSQIVGYKIAFSSASAQYKY
jgi:hypothetical protein